MELKIDKDFEGLIQPLQASELTTLEDSILKEGCRDAIVAWNYTILDGHNRYKICNEHGIEFAVLNMDFDSKDDAMLWMIRNQQGRRNLSSINRGKLALKKKKIVSALAHKNKRGAGISVANIGKINTREQLAKEAGISHGTLSKIEIVEDRGIPELKEIYSKVDSKVSADAAFQISGMEEKDQKEFVKRVESGEGAGRVCSEIKKKNKPKEVKQIAGNFERLESKCMSFTEGLQLWAEGTIVPESKYEANWAKSVLNSAPNIIMQFARLGVDVEWCVSIARGKKHEERLEQRAEGKGIHDNEIIDIVGD